MDGPPVPADDHDGVGPGAAGAGPVALVTGAAGAIGSALVHHLVGAGYRVCATDVGDPPDEVGAVATCWDRADVTDAAAMTRLVDGVVATFGRLDLVVANAGVTALGDLASTPDDTFERVVDVNLHGVVRTVRPALAHLGATGGRIVVMSSVAGFAPVVGRPAYVASKHAVTGLFESLRHELDADGIGVTVVYPTFLTTTPGDANAEAVADRPTTGPLLDADDVAAAVVDAVRRGRGKVFPGRVAKLAWMVHRLAPPLYARQMRRRLQH